MCPLLPAVTLLLTILPCGSPGLCATLYVAQQDPAASDDNPGSEDQPLLTISAAMQRVQPGDTVWVKDGVYRESVVGPGEDWKDPQRRTTLAAFPGHRPVIKGSDIVPGPWHRLDGDRPIFWCDREPYTQMVFVDELPLRQIGLQGHPNRLPEKSGGFVWQKRWDGTGLQDMAPSTFCYDPEAKRLYLWLADGSDPAAHQVEAAVRHTGISLRGTWTLSGFTVCHIMDGLWPHEQAVALTGNRCLVEGCRITHNEFIGLIVSGEDCIVRGNELAHNGLEGFTSNYGYRMLVEGNEFHDNAWRGDVVCLTAGNKWVMWRDSQFLRNWWHDEPTTALWLDISDANILVAENRFDNCAVGVYFEISRWAVIVNNLFRHCGRAVWSYGADVLIAHNVFDRCGEGVLVSGYPRHCNENQSVLEPAHEALMAVRNNLVVNNIFVDCVGANVGITEDTAFGAANYSDYNVFAWTLPAYHHTGNHINFMSGWNALYGRLPEWRIVRHYDTHSVVADPGLYQEVRNASPWTALTERDVVPDAGFVNRQAGDYRLAPDSPLRGRGVRIPNVLNSAYLPGTGNQIASRAWAKTLLSHAPDPTTARPVYGGDPGHYRLQPLPAFHRLVDLDAQPPDDPGLNLRWRASGSYPQFDSSRPPDTAADTDWMVYPANRLADPSFDRPFTTTGTDGPGPWFTPGELHTFSGMACANLFPRHQTNVIAYQKVGTLPAECQYILWGDMHVASASDQFGGVADMYLATGDTLQPLAMTSLRASPGKTRTWNTCFLHHRTGKASQDTQVGKDLYVVIAARVEGPAAIHTDAPVVFARWDNLALLTGEAT